MDHAFNDIEHLKGENHETGDSLKNEPKKTEHRRAPSFIVRLKGVY